MTNKTSAWLIAMGCFVAFAGLSFIPAAFGPDAERTMLGAGTTLFGFGMLLVAGGVYVKAHAIPSTPGDQPAAAKRIRKPNCDRCAKEEPVIQCRVHQLHLCGDCLAEHYDFRSCAYVPSTRRVTAKSVAAQAASS